MIVKFTLKTTKRNSFIDITPEIRKAISESGMREGTVIVYCPHTTAAITINENGDPDVLKDLELGLSKISPDRTEYRHFEGNSDAHLKSSLIGASETLIVSEGKPILGTWQSVYFCEFDGPRTRYFYVSC